MTSKSKNHIKKGIVLAVLAAVVLTAYWPVLNTKALMLDDDQYLANNYLVRNPGWGSAKRFFTEVFQPSTVRGYYHPLAMVSLMVDVALGAGTDNLKQFHITSLSLHLFNTLLVVWLFYLFLAHKSFVVLSISKTVRFDRADAFSRCHRDGGVDSGIDS